MAEQLVKVLYLVHDLTDPAVRRRVAMLKAGGADLRIAGFHRDRDAATELEGVPVLALGQTHDGNFAQRIAKVLAVAAKGLAPRLGAFEPDVVIARNLEMLALAARFARSGKRRVRLVYEILDIHRLLLAQGPAGAMLRALERVLLRRVSLVLTSSPAFVANYLQPIQKVEAPVALLENKVLRLQGGEPAPRDRRLAEAKRADAPIVIGWFGALRCARSLALLAEFSRAMNGRYEIVLRGRPAYREFEDFDGFVARQPHMRFEGSYRSPEDLARIYGEVDFVWAVDFFEEGLNSRWLLPNRVYEGCLHGGVPIAMADTQTAAFLRAHGIGLVLPEASAATLAALLEGADRQRLREAVRAVPEASFASGIEECAALVRQLRFEADAAREPGMAVA